MDVTDDTADGAVVEFKWDGSPVRLQFPFAEDHIAGVIRRAKTFYEIDLLRDAMSRLFYAKCAVDVGAHVGNHTVFFAKAMGLRTIAFEPNPTNFRLLEANVAANGLAEQCRLHMAAVGREPFRAKMRTHGAQRNSGACGVELTPKGDVEVVMLDEVLRDEPQVDAIKIDVESWEVRVIEGALGTLERHRPLIYIEATETTFPPIRRMLEDVGYICWMRFNFTPTFLFLPEERLRPHRSVQHGLSFPRVALARLRSLLK